MNEDIYIQLSRYTQPVLILLGTIGVILNQILFHRRKFLRTASCSLYVRVLSINDLLVLYLIVLTQWLKDQFHIDPALHYLWYCKIRIYAAFCLYAISPYCIVLVCIDRFCRASKSSQYRRIATPRIARLLIIFTILLIFLIYSHIPFKYQIIDLKCIPSDLFYHHFLGYFLLVFYCLCPPILMLIFSIWTLILIRRRRRIQQRKYQLRIILPRKRRYQRDYQLIKILILYVMTNIICTLPFAIIFLLHVYYYHHSNNNSLLVLIKCSILLCNLNHCTNFYIYTLGTPVYRRELKHLFEIL